MGVKYTPRGLPAARAVLGRLADEMGSVSAALRIALTALEDDEQLLVELDNTTARNDGGMSVSRDDAPTVLRALQDAAECGEGHTPESPSWAMAVRYRELIARLGATQ